MTYSNPAVTTDWSTFLPTNFSKIIAVCQRSSGEVMLLIDPLVYTFDIISLQLTYGYPNHIKSIFNIRPNNFQNFLYMFIRCSNLQIKIYIKKKE